MYVIWLLCEINIIRKYKYLLKDPTVADYQSKNKRFWNNDRQNTQLENKYNIE